MKLRFSFLFWWILAVICAFIFELIYADFEVYRFKNVAENVLFATGMLLTLNLFNSKKIKTILSNCYFIFFVLCLFLESSYFYLFHSNFSASALFILIETNKTEAREFLNFYLNLPILGFFIILCLLILLFFRRNKAAFFVHRNLTQKGISAILLTCLLIFMKFSGMIDPNLPYLIGISVWDYSHEKAKMEKLDIDKPIGNFNDVTFTGSSENSVYVLVIGESTTRNHLGLYGYYRNTTPKLGGISSELLIYENVISPHAFTIGALQEALTLNNFEKENESSLVQLMNQAGFKTYWFSNQRPIGPYESLVTKISQAATEVKFTNSAIAGGITPYDDVLLSFLDSALSEKEPAKKFIVLHILGTHMQYKNRYPAAYNFFKDIPKSDFSDELAHSRINAYDNAIRYMDDFLRKVIEKTREANTSSYVLYFSDHGEEVYTDRYFAGHLDDNPTKSMFEIPFVLWRSEKFKKSHPIYTQNQEKPYVLDDFIYSFADLSQVYFSGMKEKKSIFSANFEQKKRIVGNGIDYDKYFR